MWPTSCSISDFSLWYCGMSSRLGTTTWMQRDAPAHVGIALEQVLERLQAQRDALGVVEPVDAEHELAPRQQRVQLARLGLDLGRHRARMNAL